MSRTVHSPQGYESPTALQLHFQQMLIVGNQVSCYHVYQCCEEVPLPAACGWRSCDAVPFPSGQGRWRAVAGNNLASAREPVCIVGYLSSAAAQYIP